MLPDCSCEIGIQETNPGRRQGVNGRRIGRMYGWCLDVWVYLAEWYVRERPQLIDFGMLTTALKGRSHEGVLEQRVPAFAQSMGSRRYPEPRCVV